MENFEKSQTGVTIFQLTDVGGSECEPDFSPERRAGISLSLLGSLACPPVQGAQLIEQIQNWQGGLRVLKGSPSF